MRSNVRLYGTIDETDGRPLSAQGRGVFSRELLRMRACVALRPDRDCSCVVFAKSWRSRSAPRRALDKITVQIASNMVAEVCSVYVLHSDGRLELYATEGLKHEAVHLTTMRRGEGLVGLIAASAEALSLPDAQSHPAFSYKPETGEEVYSSFLGVPILRGGNTLGVLVVQNRAAANIPKRRSRRSRRQRCCWPN